MRFFKRKMYAGTGELALLMRMDELKLLAQYSLSRN
jgi:hypothetical protein